MTHKSPPKCIRIKTDCATHEYLVSDLCIKQDKRSSLKSSSLQSDLKALWQDKADPTYIEGTSLLWYDNIIDRFPLWS